MLHKAWAEPNRAVLRSIVANGKNAVKGDGVVIRRFALHKH